jgi:hypothetical protein
MRETNYDTKKTAYEDKINQLMTLKKQLDNINN